MSVVDPGSPWTIPILKQWLADKLFLSSKQYLRSGGLNTTDLQLRRLLGVEKHPIRRHLKSLFHPRRTFRDWQIYLGQKPKSNNQLPEATRDAFKANSTHAFLHLPGEIINMIEDYFVFGDMIALRLASRELFTRLVLPKQISGSKNPTDEALVSILIALGQHRGTSLVQLENDGKLAVRLHGKTYRMFYCNTCRTAHIEPYFMQNQLSKSPLVRHCGRAAGDSHRATLQQLREELEGMERGEGHYAKKILHRMYRTVKGNRMTIKRYFNMGSSSRVLYRLYITGSLGQDMALFLDNVPLCTHARKYHSKKIQDLKDWAVQWSGGNSYMGFRYAHVSELTGRYRTFKTRRLCRRPQCRTSVRFLTKKGKRWFYHTRLNVRAEMKRTMRIPKHVNSRKWRREMLAQEQELSARN